jgi:hypothetical protein
MHIAGDNGNMWIGVILLGGPHDGWKQEKSEQGGGQVVDLYPVCIEHELSGEKQRVKTYIDSHPFLVSLREMLYIPALAIRTSSLSCCFSNSVTKADTDAKSPWSRIMTFPFVNPVSFWSTAG